MAQEMSSRNEFVDFWNEILVPKFVRFKHVLVDGLTHHSRQVFPTLNVKPGDKVVDVGCGFGDTAIELARTVGPSGSVLGLDCCDAFLQFGRDDARAQGIENVRFVEADVQTYPFAPEHDFCFSRFGTQFFENPVIALKNMRQSLKPGGTMTMIVWRTIEDNPWLGLPKQIVADYLPPPGDDARTCGPGPFSMADPDQVRLQLKSAGYEDVEFERIDAPVLVGATPDDAVAFQLALGPAGEIYREAGEIAEQRHEQITAALKSELARYETDEGILMQSSSWKVTARSPG
ncbi:class I SAM-dependent methyltransferase [Dichotomicrobium thermohalophilum]|uniref:Ubiquinone/menaquinone biosynthesis C-methylase UbiE n=1 Tax=Dichotomicrobium thermohalophilum TaxID=933063 RepID=A0A397PKJ6_9HYPH|nr:class I SAM-dependent methyltransferase [Dichotomicrobium thermohalophilum]RIA47677.1 ubiquinone/menaquinone biosynthesis C-methylase UbiE [Dichotomicrobium thermohalophilum]